MTIDHFDHVPPWVRRVADTAGDRAPEPVLDELLGSLRQELKWRYGSTEFTTYRQQDNLFIEWRGEPAPRTLDDALGVDTLDNERGLDVGLLWYAEDLPEQIDCAHILYKNLT